jgi:TPR repeat protein/outer membrane protein assembly factor BamD (BamD/ComL family)
MRDLGRMGWGLLGVIREKPITTLLSIVGTCLTLLWYLHLFRKECADQNLFVCIYQSVLTDKITLEWERDVKLSDDEDRITKFIETYQTGPYVALARSRLKTAKAWVLAKRTADPALISKFLSEQRDPVFADLAHALLSQLDERAWEQAVRSGTVDAYAAYLKTWSASGHYLQQASDRLEELQDEAAWTEARSLDSAASYRSYRQRFPKGLHVKDADDRLEQREDETAWEHAKSENTAASYELYLGGRLKARHSVEAQARLDALDEGAWKQSQSLDTIGEYTSYLNRWPNGKYSQIAARRINQLQEEADWQKVTQEPSVNSIRRFIKDWPQSAHKQEAQRRLDDLGDDTAWAQFVSEATREGFQTYLHEYPHGRHEQDARRRLRALDDGAWARLSTGSVYNLRQYLSEWADDGAHLSEARRKIAELEDDQAWQDAVREQTPGSYARYLNNPSWTRHSAEAHQRLNELAELGWQRARDADTSAAYETFELNFPSSPRVGESRQRRSDLGKPQECDRLAANPDDPARVGDGTPWDLMDALSAITACKQAVTDFPRVPRFRYQLARAYQKASQHTLALPLLTRLANERYISAYDNLGWIYFDNKGVPRNIERAIGYFKQGAAANQPEAMTSLGILFEHVNRYEEAKQWYQRAANLGYERAGERLSRLESAPPPSVPPQMDALGTQMFQLLMQKAIEGMERRRR